MYVYVCCKSEYVYNKPSRLIRIVNGSAIDKKVRRYVGFVKAPAFLVFTQACYTVNKNRDFVLLMTTKWRNQQKYFIITE
jgi:hypothetical protein